MSSGFGGTPPDLPPGLRRLSLHPPLSVFRLAGLACARPSFRQFHFHALKLSLHVLKLELQLFSPVLTVLAPERRHASRAAPVHTTSSLAKLSERYVPR